MDYRFAKPDDLTKWLDVADDVGEIMRVSEMGKNAAFIEYAKRKLEQDNAIMAYDNDTNECTGFIGFSRTNNSITWLGVKEKYRKRGIASKLISLALSELNHNKTITVNTYPANYPPGQPARMLYSQHGFIETTGEVFLIDGLEMVEFSIAPNTR